ncbi:unnamed protein product [Cyprideis torosa]|uniref:Uncharacterized protein n=1 Tax=Cyprideis torosa TaxID=163714 RepID=A0A7R8ZJG2_9CRUS|nr:unnamed protein product [Cyprideis torosa]CAG0888560.1 unnamed protein product [Cyprideis torosa]
MTVPSSRYIRSPDDSCFYLDERKKDLKTAAEFCHEEFNGTLAEFDEFEMVLLIKRLNSLNVTSARTWFHTRSEKVYWDEPVGLEPEIAIKYWKFKNGSILPTAMFAEGFPTKRMASHHCSILTPTGLRDGECEAAVPTLCSMSLDSVELNCSAPMDNTPLGFLTTSPASNYIWNDVVNYECYCNGVWSQTAIKTTPSTCLGGSGWTNDGIRLDYCQHVPLENGELATNEGKACYLVVDNPPPTHPILKEKTGIFRAAAYCQSLGHVLAEPFNEDFRSIQKAMLRLYVRLLPSIDNTTFDKIAYIGLNKRNPYGHTTNQYRKRDNQTMSDTELVDVWSNLRSASSEDCVGILFDSGTPNAAACDNRNHSFAVCQLSQGATEAFSLDCIDPPWHSEMDPRMIEVSSPTPQTPGSVASFLCPAGEAMPIQQSNQIQLECIGENVGWLLKSGFPNETCSPVCDPPPTAGLVNTRYNISDSVTYYVPNDTIVYTCTTGNWFNVSGGGPPAHISTCTENSTWDHLPVTQCVPDWTFCLEDPVYSLDTMYRVFVPELEPHPEGTWARYECKCEMVRTTNASIKDANIQCYQGDWFPNGQPACFKGCDANPPTLENVTYVDFLDSSFRANLTYICHENFTNPLTRENTTLAQCFGPAGWIFPKHTDFMGCIPFCSKLLLPDELTFVDEEELPNVFLPDEAVTVRCRRGSFELPRRVWEISTVCKHNHSWTQSSFPGCRRTSGPRVAYELTPLCYVSLSSVIGNRRCIENRRHSYCRRLKNMSIDSRKYREVKNWGTANGLTQKITDVGKLENGERTHSKIADVDNWGTVKGLTQRSQTWTTGERRGKLGNGKRTHSKIADVDNWGTTNGLTQKITDVGKLENGERTHSKIADVDNWGTVKGLTQRSQTWKTGER